MQYIINVLIRVMVIAAKGGFVFYAAKKLDVQEFGVYVYVSAAISLYQYAVAGDFSYIGHRELFKNNVTIQKLLGTQIVIVFILFALSTLIFTLMAKNVLSLSLQFLTAIILFFEAVTSEIQRHLVALNRVTRSNIVLLIKSAGWIVPISILWEFSIFSPSVLSVLELWLGGLLVSLAIAVISLDIKNYSEINYDKVLARKYIRKVLIILMGTLFVRALFSIDRMMAEDCCGVNGAAIYGLYVGIASAYMSVIDSGVQAFAYSKLISIQNKNHKLFYKVTRLYLIKILAITLATIFLYEIFIHDILSLIGRGEYYVGKTVGIVLIISYAVYSIGFPSGIKLYCANKDWSISVINGVSVLPLLFVHFIKVTDVLQIGFAILVCCFLHSALKWIASRQLYNEPNEFV